MDAGVEEESGPDESPQRPQPDVRVRGSRQPRRIEREQMPRRFTPEVEVHEPRAALALEGREVDRVLGGALGKECGHPRVPGLDAPTVRGPADAGDERVVDVVPGQHVALDDPGIARSAVEGDAPRHLERSEGRPGDHQGDERPPIAGAESDDESGRQRGRDGVHGKRGAQLVDRKEQDARRDRRRQPPAMMRRQRDRDRHCGERAVDRDAVGAAVLANGDGHEQEEGDERPSVRPGHGEHEGCERGRHQAQLHDREP